MHCAESLHKVSRVFLVQANFKDRLKCITQPVTPKKNIYIALWV